MRVKVVVPSQSREVTVSAESDDPLESVKVLCSVETGIPPENQILWFGVRPLSDPSCDQTPISALGIRDGDVLTMLLRVPAPTTISADALRTAMSNAGEITLRQIASDASSSITHAGEFSRQVRADESLLSRILADDPNLAEAVLSDDLPKVSQILESRKAEREIRESQRIREEEELRMRVERNPMDVEAQSELESRIRETNVDRNLEYALEHQPESFVAVTMLYVRVVVNGVRVVAMVDTGAQQSTMSMSCAEKCGILRLADRHYNGVIRGAGEAKIYGRVHSCLLQLGVAQYLPSSFTVVEGSFLDFLLGLDLLRRHKAIVDLSVVPPVLRINGEVVPVLTDQEVAELSSTTTTTSSNKK